MDDTWAILARTISQYTVHGAPKFMIFWYYFSYTVWTPQNGKRCGREVELRLGPRLWASYYTYTHEPTTSAVTVDVLVEAAGAVLGPLGSINLPAPKKRSMS